MLQRWRDRWRLADLVLDVIDAYSRHRTGRNASLLAYMGILTVFPLLLGATTVLGLVLEGRPKLQIKILDSALSQIPVVGTSLRENGGTISGSWWALIIGLGGALWGSLRAFLALQTALDDIWEVQTGRGNFLVQRLRALIGIGVIGLGQIGAVVLAALVNEAGFPRTSDVLITLGSFALNVGVVAMMYRYLTSRPVTWTMVWPGAVFTGALYSVLQLFGTKLVTAKLDDAEVVYGALGGLVALAGWISLHGLVALLGAELNAALDRRRNQIGPVASEEATAAFKTAPAEPA
jgi:membrane protein